MTDVRNLEVGDRIGGFELRSYWFGGKWCPAVLKIETGWRIRVGWQTGGGWEYRYFETDGQGIIRKSPFGYARDYNGQVRVTNVADLAERLAATDIERTPEASTSPRFQI